VHFVTKVKKRNRKKSGGKQNGCPDERRRKGLSKEKQKNKTFETSALNCFTLPKTRTKEHHVQAIKENFPFLRLPPHVKTPDASHVHDIAVRAWKDIYFCQSFLNCAFSFSAGVFTMNPRKYRHTV
jgi:hypothetical protein